MSQQHYDVLILVLEPIQYHHVRSENLTVLAHK